MASPKGSSRFAENERLVAQVAEATGYFRAEIRQLLPIIFDEIAAALARGEDVRIGKAFGTFFVRPRRFAASRLPRAAPLPGGSYRLIKFAPALRMRRTLGNPSTRPRWNRGGSPGRCSP